VGIGVEMDECTMTEGGRLKTPLNYATVNCPPQLNIVELCTGGQSNGESELVRGMAGVEERNKASKDPLGKSMVGVHAKKGIPGTGTPTPIVPSPSHHTSHSNTHTHQSILFDSRF